jgi:hypothetical protein
VSAGMSGERSPLGSEGALCRRSQCSADGTQTVPSNLFKNFEIAIALPISDGTHPIDTATNKITRREA